MRVISGIYKRRRFDVPRTFKARPTTDFAKENLFNVLNNYIDFEEESRLLTCLPEPEVLVSNWYPADVIGLLALRKSLRITRSSAKS